MARPDSGSSPSRAREEGDGPDRWGLPVGGREERGRELGRGEGIGPAGLGCAGRKGKKGKGEIEALGWARKREPSRFRLKKEKVFHFLKTTQTHSFEFKLGEFKFN